MPNKKTQFFSTVGSKMLKKTFRSGDVLHSRHRKWIYLLQGRKNFYARKKFYCSCMAGSTQDENYVETFKQRHSLMRTECVSEMFSL